MANRIEGVTEKLMECASKEFLEKGFRDASLRTIAGNADTTPRSIYTRYGDKEGLFGALVSPALDVLKKQYQVEQEAYHQRPAEQQKELFSDNDFRSYYQNVEKTIINHIYDHFDAFKLLVDCSEGTCYANFMDDFINLDVEYTLKYIETTNNPVLRNGKASLQLVKVLSRLLYQGFFEAVRRNLSREEAYVYIRQLQTFFQSGWKELLCDESE